MRNFREELPETICLRGPSGSTWRVRLRRRNGEEDVVLSHGWDVFVKDHGLEERDFLMFQYTGGSTFSVEIFDFTSRCEKEGAYFVNKHSKKCSDRVCSLQKKVGEVAEGVGCFERESDGEDGSGRNVNRGRRGKKKKGVERKGDGGAAENDVEFSDGVGRLRSETARRRRKKKEKNDGVEAGEIVKLLKWKDGEDDSDKNVEKRGRERVRRNKEEKKVGGEGEEIKLLKWRDGEDELEQNVEKTGRGKEVSTTVGRHGAAAKNDGDSPVSSRLRSSSVRNKAKKFGEEAEEIKLLKWRDGEDDSEKHVEKKGRGKEVVSAVGVHGGASENDAEFAVSHRLRSATARRNKMEKMVVEEGEEIKLLKWRDGGDDSEKNVEKRGRGEKLASSVGPGGTRWSRRLERKQKP